MSEQYFEQALHNFIKDFNYGGAIAHLADKGYTLRQIRERIGSHIPEDYIREQMIKSYVEHGYLRFEEPGTEKREKVSMIRETGPYGRVSYRQVREIIEIPGLPLAERVYRPLGKNSLKHFLWEKTREDGEDCYLSFVMTSEICRNIHDMYQRTDFLDAFQNISGIFYLKITSRVLELAEALYESGHYSGTAYFLKLGLKYSIAQPGTP